MTRSRFLIRQSIPPVVVTRTRRGAVIELVKRGMPLRYVGLLVTLALMLGAALCAAWQAANPIEPVLTDAEVREREAASFQAGRDVAYEEMSHGLVEVYRQGRADGVAAVAAEARARGGVR